MQKVTCSAVSDSPVAESTRGVDYEDVLQQIGTGRYQYRLFLSCSLLTLALGLDLFSPSVVLPPVTCDLALSAQQAAALSAMPLAGILISSWGWGLSSDVNGRRRTLLVATAVGSVFSVLTSLAPGFVSLCVLKFFSAVFMASAQAATFSLVGEMMPVSSRNHCLFLLVSVAMLTQLVLAVIAIPVLSLSFRVPLAWLSIELRPWRLLLFLMSVPGVLGLVLLVFCRESTKFLLSQGHHERALADLRYIYCVNNPDKTPAEFKTQLVRLSEETAPLPARPPTSRWRRLWEQTAPLFRPPLLRHSIVIYYIMLTSYMTSTGYSMWVPSITNLFFSGDSSDGLTFCEVVESSAAANVTQAAPDCDHTVDAHTLYALMAYSGLSVLLNTLLGLGTARAGRRRSTQLVMACCSACGVLLYVVRAPLLVLAAFYGYLYVYVILGALNSYIVELYPTHLRSMATGLSVMVARGSGLLSVNLVALVLPRHCELTVGVFVGLVASGFVATFFLPPDERHKEHQHQQQHQHPQQQADKVV